MGVRIVCVLFQHSCRNWLYALVAAASDQKQTKIERSFTVLGVQLDRPLQLTICIRRTFRLQIAFGQFEVGGRKVWIDSYGVGKLYDCLRKFTILQITMAAFEVFLFLNIRIAVTSR